MEYVYGELLVFGTLGVQEALTGDVWSYSEPHCCCSMEV
jgi:hypothetical protein